MATLSRERIVRNHKLVLTDMVKAGDPDPDRHAVKMATEFIRRNGGLLGYPVLGQLTMREALLAYDFASNYLKWPGEWSQAQFDHAIARWDATQWL